MSTFWLILLAVLFSLPSLLGKKSKKGNVARKTVVSGENIPETAVYADDEDALEEIKRQVFGQSFDSQQESAAHQLEQFLYDEYNPQSEKQEDVKPTPDSVMMQSEPDYEQGCVFSFNLRDAVIQNVILENPYI